MNKMACDLETGICGEASSELEEIVLPKRKKIDIYYFTDPICSHCWAIEPVLKRLEEEYGGYFTIHYRMGGLLEKWDQFQDASNGISKPADVAYHWDEVGLHYRMWIDGDIWLEDPLHSSYPPSIAYKAAQAQSEDLAKQFLRRLREIVFVEKKNICKEEHLLQAVRQVGLDEETFLQAYHDPTTTERFYQDMREGREMGALGFPTFIFINEEGRGLRLSGSRPYHLYVEALQKMVDIPLIPKSIQLNVEDLVKKYKFVAPVELSMVLQKSEQEIVSELRELAALNKVTEVTMKQGSFWSWNV